MIPRQRRRRLRQSAAGPLHISSRSNYARGPVARLSGFAVWASLLLWAAIAIGWWLMWRR